MPDVDLDMLESTTVSLATSGTTQAVTSTTGLLDIVEAVNETSPDYLSFAQGKGSKSTCLTPLLSFWYHFILPSSHPLFIPKTNRYTILPEKKTKKQKTLLIRYCSMLKITQIFLELLQLF